MNAIEQMRVDFRLVADEMLDTGWTEADVEEMRAVAKDAAAGGDVARLADVASLMAALAAPIRQRRALAEGINARIRAMIEEQRKVEYFKARQAA